LHGYSCSVPSDGNIRKQLYEILEDKGVEYLYHQLQKRDPEYANKITQRDKQKILRALEVISLSDKPFSSFHTDEIKKKWDEILYVVLVLERKELYERINKRVDFMMESGFMEEVEGLMKKGYKRTTKSLCSIGYRELIAHYFGEISLEDAVEKIKTSSRRLAKRQLTWHKRYTHALFLENKKKNCADEILRIL